MIPVFNFLPLNMPIRGILGIIQTQNGYKENNMDQKPEAENPEDIMKASAEEWSKPEEPQSEPEAVGEHDRWGSPIPVSSIPSQGSDWQSTPAAPGGGYTAEAPKKSRSKWWIILIVIVVVLCLCLCVASALGLPFLGMNFFKDIPLEFNSW